MNKHASMKPDTPVYIEKHTDTSMYTEKHVNDMPEIQKNATCCIRTSSSSSAAS